MRTVNLEKWRGKRDPGALDPASMQFQAVAAKRKCAGCVFNGQWSAVCMKAGELAVRAGLPDCESGFIYIAVEIDVRQQELFDANEKG